jgi:leucyl/phenylalanyl-tRNA--protein transferase
MTSLPWLDTEFLWFPPPEEALEEPDGLLALGGDLAPERLVHAYQNGIFPWFSDDQPILWWSPDPRCVLFPDEVHISRSLKRTLNKGYFSITADQAFSEVIHFCATVREEGTWITNDMISAYTTLHQQGTAHSFEAWNPRGELVGGLYGIALGKCFFGESMFSLETDASKVLMVAIAYQLDAWGYQLMDCQVESGHLLRMGARCITRSDFLSILRKYVQAKPDHTSWAMDWRWPGAPPAGHSKK